jgi:hypothetical protein
MSDQKIVKSPISDTTKNPIDSVDDNSEGDWLLVDHPVQINCPNFDQIDSIKDYINVWKNLSCQEEICEYNMSPSCDDDDSDENWESHKKVFE